MRILIVDDHPEVRRSLGLFLSGLGHEAVEAASGEEALQRLEGVGLVLSDLRMPGLDGHELLTRIRQRPDAPPVALMTAFGGPESAAAARRAGAVDYFHKPIDVREVHALVERLAAAPAAAMVLADGLVVVDDDDRRTVELCDRLHGLPDLPVLIEGPTGAGKELVARRIHHGGRPQAAGPFVALNCAAIAPGLFEAELFGYAPGAFTGAAVKGARGKLALAASGTVLLDEVAELPADQQAKLLRLLEDRRWYPVGGDREETLQARVVCACNADLWERVASGRFREDLYYRLKVMRVRLPALRERPARIVPLAEALLARIRARFGRGPDRLATEALPLLLAHPWPGNVRELLHLLEQVAVLHPGGPLRASDLAPALAGGRAPSAGASRLLSVPTAADLPEDGLDLDAWEKAIVAAALERCEGSPVRAATYLRITRKVLYTLRKRYGLLEAGTDDEPA